MTRAAVAWLAIALAGCGSSTSNSGSAGKDAGSGGGNSGTGGASGIGGTGGTGGTSGAGGSAASGGGSGGQLSDGGPDAGCGVCPAGQHCVDGVCDQVLDLDAGESFTCARMLSKTVRCWGSNQFGQLGDGTTQDRGYAVAVHGVDGIGTLNDIEQITTSNLRACSLSSSGSTACWGGTGQTTKVPAESTFPQAAEIRLGEFLLGRKADGTLILSGPSPVSSATSIALNEAFACALDANQIITCWDQYGTWPAAQVPDAAVDGGLFQASKITVGAETGCAIGAQGVLACWGEGVFGALGDGINDFHKVSAAIAVKGKDGVGELGPVVDVDANSNTVCAARSDGSVWCWGMQDIEISEAFPHQMALANAIKVVVAPAHVCALRNDGTVGCVGWNTHGELGGSTPGQSSWQSAVTVAGL